MKYVVSCDTVVRCREKFIVDASSIEEAKRITEEGDDVVYSASLYIGSKDPAISKLDSKVVEVDRDITWCDKTLGEMLREHEQEQ